MTPPQITSKLTDCLRWNKRKHQISILLYLCEGIHRSPVDSPLDSHHMGSIMLTESIPLSWCHHGQPHFMSVCINLVRAKHTQNGWGFTTHWIAFCLKIVIYQNRHSIHIITSGCSMSASMPNFRDVRGQVVTWGSHSISSMLYTTHSSMAAYTVKVNDTRRTPGVNVTVNLVVLLKTPYHSTDIWEIQYTQELYMCDLLCFLVVLYWLSLPSSFRATTLDWRWNKS